MTLNGVMALILRYFTEFGNFGVNYVKVVEDREDQYPSTSALSEKQCEIGLGLS